jgi:acyl carrier protein
MVSEKIAVPPTVDDIRAWLVERVSEELRVPASSIDIHARFSALGLPSIEAASLTGDLSRWLGLKLSPLMLWDYPTIDRLARHLAGEHVEKAA